jgi:hypothetical protein
MDLLPSHDVRRSARSFFKGASSSPNHLQVGSWGVDVVDSILNLPHREIGAPTAEASGAEQTEKEYRKMRGIGEEHDDQKDTRSEKCGS